MSQFVAINTLNVIKRKQLMTSFALFQIALHPSVLCSICLSRMVNRIWRIDGERIPLVFIDLCHSGR